MTTQTPRRDPAASMSLINELMQNPLDPAYKWEADKRVAAGRPAADSLRSPLLFVIAVVIGIGFALAATTLRVPASQAQQDRDGLIRRIHKAQSSIDSDTKTIGTLQKQNAALQASALRNNDQDTAAAQVEKLSGTVGAVAVKGPGLTLSMDNPKTAPTDLSGTDPRAGTGSTTTITSADLQQIVNGLWESGAEAISINGQRLTTMSAIRFAGQAILVNYRPLATPYVITAIGPPAMDTRFQAGSGGTYLDNLVKAFGVQQTLTTSSSLSVPASSLVDLRYAKELKETK